ncbi:MAG: hypothetical protein FGM24_03630 [Candidatus Kapabacteria bacterium]|nr:hypothetical protein [Candidatus Kapabacteria bacterium]
MKSHTKVVWLGYASIAFSIVWGLPGLLCAVYARRVAAAIPLSDAAPDRVRRDVRGGLLLARVGMVLSIIVIAVVLWSIISTLIWLL